MKNSSSPLGSAEEKTAILPSPIEKGPPRIEGEVLLTLKKKKPHRTRRYYAVLIKGYLQLFTNKQSPNYRYQIDLSKVLLSNEEGSIAIGFRVESHILTPVDAKDLQIWRDTALKHQQYRKSRSIEARSAESEKAIKAESVTSYTTASDFQDWNTTDMCWKMIDDIEQMQGLTVEVLEKIMALAIEMRKVANELSTTFGLFQKESRITQFWLSTNLPSLMSPSKEPSVSTAHTKEIFSFDEDDDFEGCWSTSHEYDSDLLTADGKPSIHILHSLQVTANVEQRRTSVISRSLEILGRRNTGTFLGSSKSSAVVPDQASPTSDEEYATDDSNVGDIVASPKGAEMKTAIEHSVARTPIDTQKKRQRIRRSSLPAQQSPSERISFSALGRMILQRAGVPISHYEPLTALQLLCEELRFSNLLNDACSKDTAEERMVYVAAFALSTYSNSKGRFRKFFNPMLGETYEYVQEDFKFHGEQVSHHPPISAGHAAGNGWTWFQTFGAEITWNTWAQTCEFAPDRPVRLRLCEEEYSWNKIVTHVENLLCIPEQRKLYHEGTIYVRSSSGVSARLIVKKNKDVSGEITYSDGRIFCKLSGRWDESIFRQLDNGERKELFGISKYPVYSQYFGFSDFTMGLNQLDPEDEPLLPPTDSRLRPDVRNLEKGNLKDAIAYKQELEKAQRARNINEETHKPLWFEEKNDTFTNTKIFMSTGKYWQARETRFEQQKKDNQFIPVFKVSITI